MMEKYICPKCNKPKLEYDYQSYYHNERDHWFKCSFCGWNSGKYDGRASSKRKLADSLKLKQVQLYTLLEIYEIAKEKDIKFKRYSWDNIWLVYDKSQHMFVWKDNKKEAMLTCEAIVAEDWVYEELEEEKVVFPRIVHLVINKCEDCIYITSNNICEKTGKTVQFNEIDIDCPLEIKEEDI